MIYSLRLLMGSCVSFSQTEERGDSEAYRLDAARRSHRRPHRDRRMLPVKRLIARMEGGKNVF